jgi:hypothetical protein
MRSQWPTSHSDPLENQAVAASAGSHPKVLEPPLAGLLRMKLGRRPGSYLRVRKTIRRSSKTVLFEHRSPSNLNEQNVDWLAGVVRREYNAAHSDPLRHRAFYLSDC